MESPLKSNFFLQTIEFQTLQKYSFKYIQSYPPDRIVSWAAAEFLTQLIQIVFQS